MTPAARHRSQVRKPIFALSGAAWILILMGPDGALAGSHCEALRFVEGKHFSTWLGPGLIANSLHFLAVSWLPMLIAMMLPLLTAPVRHVRSSSFPNRQWRAVELFLMGYCLLWMAGGLILLTMASILQIISTGSFVLVTSLVVLTLLWQFSPLKQHCLNRSHVHPALPAMGRATDIAAFRFGFIHGGWCIGSCWALMLLPLPFTASHFAIMFAVFLWMAAERLERTQPPRWSIRIPTKAVRLLSAQAKVLLLRATNSSSLVLSGGRFGSHWKYNRDGFL